MKKRNNGFLSKKIDLAFSFIINAFVKITIFLSGKTGELFAFAKDVKEKSKDLIKTNLEVAEEHVMNNNLFDAKLRYKFILRMDKQNFQALSLLGYIYFKEKKLQKSLFYLEKSLPFVPNQEEKQEISEMIEKIKNMKND